MSWFEYFWPIKTGVTVFDYWTLSHFAFWFFVGSTVAAVQVHRAWALGIGISLALLWEVFERFAEKKWPEMWLSPESWVNAYVSDLAMCPLAFAIAWWGFDWWRP